MQGTDSADISNLFKPRKTRAGKKRKRRAREDVAQQLDNTGSSSTAGLEDQEEEDRRRLLIRAVASNVATGLRSASHVGRPSGPPMKRPRATAGASNPPDSDIPNGKTTAGASTKQLGATFQQGAGLQGTHGSEDTGDLDATDRARRDRFVQEQLKKMANGSKSPNSEASKQAVGGGSSESGAMDGQLRGIAALRELERSSDTSLFAEPEAVRRARAAARQEQQSRRLPLGPSGAPYSHSSSSSSSSSAQGAQKEDSTGAGAGAADAADGDVGQGGMLAYNTGLAEVELPAEERLRVIAETERALAAAQKKRAQAEADAAALAEREAEAQGAIGGESGVVTEAGASGDAVRFSGSSVAADFTKHRRAFSYKMRSKGASARLFRRKEEARRLRARGEHARADAMEKDAEEEARRAMVAAQEAERKALHWEDEHHGGGEEEAGAASNRASASDEQLFNRIKGRTYMRRRG